MNNMKERMLHRTATFIGGFAAIYTVMIRFNLGSSQTLNLLDLLRSLLGKDMKEFLVRVIGMLLYAGAIFGVTILGKKTKLNLRLFSMSLNIVGFIVLALLPTDMNNFVGLYPAFIMMSVQWVVFGNMCGYTSAPIFSTNNLRQTVAAFGEYICDKKPEQLAKAKFFGGTLLMFHVGALCGYFLVKVFSVKAAFFGIVPCVAAVCIIALPKLVSFFRKAEVNN